MTSNIYLLLSTFSYQQYTKKRKVEHQSKALESIYLSKFSGLMEQSLPLVKRSRLTEASGHMLHTSISFGIPKRWILLSESSHGEVPDEGASDSPVARE